MNLIWTDILEQYNVQVKSDCFINVSKRIVKEKSISSKTGKVRVPSFKSLNDKNTLCLHLGRLCCCLENRDVNSCLGGLYIASLI